MSLLRLPLAFALLGPVVAAAPKDYLPVAIYSRVAANYERELQTDGQPRREHYAIGYGGRLDGTVWDESQEKENFPEIAGLIAEELAKQNYYFSPDKDTTDLLVVIHWGRTNPLDSVNFTEGVSLAGDAFRQLNDAQNLEVGGEANSPEQAEQNLSLISERDQAIQEANAALNSSLALLQMEEREQSRKYEEIARVIGYTDELNRNNDVAQFAGSSRFHDLLTEVRDPRYYVVVSAYDFQKITQSKRKPPPRWVTRFSISSRGNDFMDRVDEMAASAGQFFGRESGRLIRDNIGVVEIGEIEVVEGDPSPSDGD